MAQNYILIHIYYILFKKLKQKKSNFLFFIVLYFFDWKELKY